LLEIREVLNSERQKKGIDLILLLPNDQEAKIEEKARSQVFDDILLEDWSNYEQKTPGWARDLSKTTDYLSYIQLPTRKLWLLYYPALRRFFLDNYKDIETRFSYVFGKTYNAGNLLYTTANYPLPWSYFPQDWLLKNCWKYEFTSQLELPNPNPVSKEVEVTEEKGHCKHGEFILREGCPQCMEERRQQDEPANTHRPYHLADGAIIPSVTTILSILDKPGLPHWAWDLGRQGLDYREIRDAAGRVGTLA
ncbi:unnamed protein product, partial [marine sediment metagenome]